MVWELPVFVDRLSLFDEGGHALGAIFQRKGRVEQVALDIQAFGERRLECAIDRFLGHRGSRTGHRSNFLGHAEDFFHQLVRRNNAAD